MRASFFGWLASSALLALPAIGCAPGGEGDVHGLHTEGGVPSEAGACAISPGSCVGGGGDLGVDGARTDAGRADGGDAATPDGGGVMCQAPGTSNHFTVSGEGLTPTFTVRRVWAEWAASACTSPRLRLALTDADLCLDDAGQELDIVFYASGTMAATTTVYTLGSAASASIEVRYLPPVTAPTPDRVGPCASSGTITFDSLSWPPMSGSHHVSGNLSATLYPCGSPTASPAWILDGAFDVPIDTPQPACP